MLALNGDDGAGLLVLDEPDANLDAAARVRLAQLLKQKAAQEHAQVILSSFRREMLDCADTVLLVQNEEVRKVSDPAELGESIWR